MQGANGQIPRTSDLVLIILPTQNISYAALPIRKAIAELGKLPKTVHLPNYLNDETYRRIIGGQLDLHEQRHSLARVVFGKKGEVRKRYGEGQEDQLGALDLVVNAVSLWNTRYFGLALETLTTEDFEACVEDVERFPPLRHEHINLPGRATSSRYPKTSCKAASGLCAVRAS